MIKVDHRVLKIRRLSEELEAYNPMIPSGRNFKATFMIEYTDSEIRATQLEKMVGIEDLVWMQIDRFDKIWASADEDLELSTESKTSAVHFMRIEVSDEKASALKNGSTWSIGVQHPAYTYEYQTEGSTRESLLNDFQ